MKHKYYVMYRYASSVCQYVVISENEIEAIKTFESQRKKFAYHHSHFMGCSLSPCAFAWDAQRISAMRKK